jgi:hypothetical protein
MNFNTTTLNMVKTLIYENRSYIQHCITLYSIGKTTIHKSQGPTIYIMNDEFQVTYISVEKYFIKQ